MSKKKNKFQRSARLRLSESKSIEGAIHALRGHPLTLFSFVSLATAMFCLTSCSTLNAPDTSAKTPEKTKTAGAVQQVKVIVGPFDIHRKYRSMEGPYVTETLRISDLLAQKIVIVGEDKVKFVEDGYQATMAASVHDHDAVKPALVKTHEPKQLIWLTGVKLEVLDEQGKVQPTSEFICHCNVDLDRRDQVFPETHTGSTRLFTITQGQTDIHFPEGCAVPLASDELIHLKFQVANRTTTAHRRLKHLCTIDFVKDSDLTKPMTALSWYTPFMAVELKDATKLPASQMHGPSCLALSTAENAPNAIPGTVIDYAQGRKVTGHWKVPPGLHLYQCPLTTARDFGFNSEDRIVRTVWTHCHPLCKKVTMLVCDGSKKTPIWSVDVNTKTDSGLETAKISDLYFKDGVVLPKGKQFEIDAVYDNTTGTAQDSMVSQGIFFEDPKFVKPSWTRQHAFADNSDVSTKECTDLYCGVK
ncbi:hypothetical protein BH10CYA1_BH10CYA1_20300 [soil metagenome]